MFVTRPNVRDTQIEEAVYSVEIRRGLRRTSGLSGVGPPPELRTIQRLASFDVAGILRLYHFPAKNSDIRSP